MVPVRLSSSFACAWADRSSTAGLRARRTTLALVVALFASGAAHAQSITPQLGDPKKCVVILDGMGNVGFRISDAQVVADGVITQMRKRVGFEGAHYAGVAESAAAMKRILATPEGAGPQEAQLAWFKQCEKNAPWRMKARFGTAKMKGKPPHWVTVSCRKKDADPKAAPTEEKTFEGKTFLEARDAMVAALPTFCGAIPSVGIIPVEGSPPPPVKPKEVKPWTPPPRRD